MVDPLRQIERLLANPAALATGRQAAAASALPDLTDEEYQSMLGTLGRSVMSGVGHVGGFLDKMLGGRAVRGLLGGKPEELLSIIPGSDVMGLTDREDVVYGKDLLGWDDPKSWLDDIAGFAVELPLDPSLYFGNFGGRAASASGQLLQKAGMWKHLPDVARRAGKQGVRYSDTIEGLLKRTGLGQRVGPREARLLVSPEDVIAHPYGGPTSEAAEATIRGVAGQAGNIDELLKQPAGGLMRAAIPGTPGKILGTGETGQKIARGLDILGEGAMKVPGMRTVSNLFDRAGAGAPTARSAAVARKVDEGKQLGRTQGAMLAAPFMDRMWRTGKLKNNEGMLKLREYLEHDASPATVTTPGGRSGGTLFHTDLQPPPGLKQETLDWIVDSGLKEDADALKGVMAPMLKAEQEAGLNTKQWVSEFFTEYFPAMAKEAGDKDVDNFMSRILSAAHGSQTHRQRRFDVLGGRALVDRMAMDKRISGWATRETKNRRAYDVPFEGQGYGGARPGEGRSTKVMVRRMREAYPEIDQMLNIGTDEDYRAVEGLAKWLSHLDPKHADEGIPFFDNPLDAFQRRVVRSEQSINTANVALRTLKELSEEVGPDDVRVLSEWTDKVDDATKLVPVQKIIRESGLTETFDARLADAMGLTDDVVDGVIETSKLDKLRRHHVPADIAAMLSRTVKGFTVPEEIGKIGQFFDKFTNFFKASVTGSGLGVVAFNERNFHSGQAMNWLLGLYRNPYRAYRGVVDTDALLRGGTVKGAAKIQAVKDVADGLGVSLTGPSADKEATKILAQIYYATNVAPHGGGYGIAREGVDEIQKFARDIPGLEPKSIKSIVESLKPLRKPDGKIDWANWLNPLKQRGIVGDETTFVGGRFGEALGGRVEAYNRGGPFLELLREGYDPLAAKRKVDIAQVNYADATAFEKKFMKRLIPFYMFTRKMIETHLDELAQRPGGRLAQTIRATNRAQQAGSQEGPLPEHVAQTVSIPLPWVKQKEGHAAYLTGLGLPFEDVFSLLRPGATPYHTVAGSLQEMLSRMNPAVKPLAELPSGKLLFSGQDIEDADRPIARTLSNIGLFDEPPNTSLMGEYAASNVPGTREISMLRTATDPRKSIPRRAMQLLTGLRTTDIDLEKSKNIAIREYTEDLLRSRPDVHTLRPRLFFDDVSRMSKATKRTAALHKAQEKRGRAAAAAEKNASKKKSTDYLDDLLDFNLETAIRRGMQ